MPRIGGALDVVQVNDPATPAAGRQHIYVKSDSILYTKDSTGTVRAQVDSGSTQTIAGAKTVTGLFTFSGGSAGGAGQINLTGASGQIRSVVFQTGALNRWAVRAGGEAESGADEGSDFRIIPADDAGTFQSGRVFTISRATGNVTTSGTLSEGANRVYSLGNKVPVAGISATGTASATTLLRGDGTWDGTVYTRITTIEGAYVNLTGPQTITGIKTISSLLVANGGIQIPRGTVTAPTIKFEATGNTGIYSPAVDQIGISTNGTAALTIDAVNQVSIPAGYLTVGAATSLSTTYVTELGSRATTSVPLAIRRFSTAHTGDAVRLLTADGTGTFWGVTHQGFMFANGAGAHLRHLPTPAAPALSIIGTPGTTTYSYRVAAINELGTTIAGVAASIATGPATLNATDKVRLTWTAIVGAQSYNVYGRTAGTEGLLGNVVGVTTFDDTGQTVGAAAPATTTGTTTLTVDRWAAQTGNIFQWRSGTTAATPTVLGAIDANGYVQVPVGSTTVPSITFTGDTDTGFSSPAANQIEFIAGGASRLMLSATAETHTLPATFSSTLGVTGVSTFTGIPTGTGIASLAEQVRTDINLQGGGTLTTSATGAVKWTQRFMAISNGYGTHFSTNGFFEITMPANGTVISGVGGGANRTVAADGTIPLGTWEALYYILPIGGSSTSLPANFRIVGYTSALEVPPGWTPIAMVNSDATTIKWGTGFIQDFGGTIDTTKGFGTAQFVTLDTVQTVATAKTWTAIQTFNSIPVVPNLSFSVAKINATGTANSTSYLRGDGTWSALPASAVTSVNTRTGAVTGLAEANAVVDLTTPQTIGGAKTLSALLTGSAGVTVTGGGSGGGSQITVSSAAALIRSVTFQTGTLNRWAIRADAAAEAGANAGSDFRIVPSDDAGAALPALAFAITRATGNVTVGGTLSEGVNRVYSAGNLVPVAGLSATGTRDATTFLRGDNTWATPAAAAPANMVTTDTTQTITGSKTFASSLIVSLPSNQNHIQLNDSTTGVSSNRFIRVNGTTFEVLSFAGSPLLQLTSGGTMAINEGLNAFGPVKTTGTLTGAGVYDGTSAIAANRVYSAGNKVPIAGLSATGTPSATTFLRGDNTWAVPAAPANTVTTDTTQTITGLKTLRGLITSDSTGQGLNGLALHWNAVSQWNIYQNTSGPMMIQDAVNNRIAATFTAGAAGAGLVTINSPATVTGNLLEGANRVYSAGNKVPIAGLSATGTPSAANFLRGDNTWAVPAAPTNMVTTDTTQNITGAKTLSSPVVAVLAPATSGATVRQSTFLTFNTEYWNGTAAVQETGLVRVDRGSATAGDYYFTFNKSIAATGVVEASAGFFENGSRVYSVNNKVPVGGLSATGTPSATTYLRGDNTWATVDASVQSVVSVTTTYTIPTTVSTVFASGTFTTTLPTAVGNTGRTFNVKNTGTGTITLASNGGTIDGSSTVPATTKRSITVVSDGTNWHIV